MKITIKGSRNRECEVEFNTRRNDDGYFIIDIDHISGNSIIVDQPDGIAEHGTAMLIIQYYGSDSWDDDREGYVIIKPVKVYDNKLDDIDLARKILSSIERFNQIDSIIYCPEGIVSPLRMRADADLIEDDPEWGTKIVTDIALNV